MSTPLFLGIVLVVAVAAGVGFALRLRRRQHRLPEDADLPARAHVWVAVVTPVAAVVAATGVAGRWPWWVAIGPVLLVLGWMFAAGIDADVGRLPNVLTLPLAGFAVAWGLALAWLFARPDAALRTVVGALGLAALYLGLMVLSRVVPPHQEGLGAGDVKLALSIGATLGWFSWQGVWVSVLLAFVIGAVWAGVLLVSGRAGRHDSFSFGPAMVLGAALALLAA